MAHPIVHYTVGLGKSHLSQEILTASGKSEAVHSRSQPCWSPGKGKISLTCTVFKYDSVTRKTFQIYTGCAFFGVDSKEQKCIKFFFLYSGSFRFVEVSVKLVIFIKESREVKF